MESRRSGDLLTHSCHRETRNDRGVQAPTRINEPDPQKIVSEGFSESDNEAERTYELASRKLSKKIGYAFGKVSNPNAFK